MPKKRTATTIPPLDHIAEPLRGLAVPMNGLTPDPANTRLHDEKNLRAIAASLKRFGQVKPIVVNLETGQIVAGNGTYLAARQLGWREIAATRIRVTPEIQAALSIADNRTSDLSTWDNDRLEAVLAGLGRDEPDLFADLALEGLAKSLEPEEKRGKRGRGDKFLTGDEKFQVLVTVADEAAQIQLIERLIGEGFEVKALIV